MTDKPKRRWYQFSLRSMFVLMTLVACACSWYAYEMNKAAKRRESVAAIIKLGGKVRYDFEMRKPPGWFSWMRRLHDDEYLGNAASVSFRETQVTDAGLVHLRDLPNLRWLLLDSTQITDAGLVHLRGLTKLEWLELRNTQISDAGLHNLKDLKNLVYVGLSGTQITNEGSRNLEEELPHWRGPFSGSGV